MINLTVTKIERKHIGSSFLFRIEAEVKGNSNEFRPSKYFAWTSPTRDMNFVRNIRNCGYNVAPVTVAVTEVK